MASQLFILKKEFNINPTILISIIDQTDIGDELYRYRSLDKKSFACLFISKSSNKKKLKQILDLFK